MPNTSVAHSTLLLTAANLAIRFVSMLFGIYLSGRLGAAGLGLMQLITSVGILAMTIGSSGIRIAAMYLTAEEFGRHRPGGVRSAVTHCMVFGLLLSTIAGLLLMILSPKIALQWLMDARAASSLRLLGFFLPVTCLNSIMTGYFTACGKVQQMVVIELSERLLCILVTVLLLRFWAGSDTERSCCAIFGGSAITCALSFFVMFCIFRSDQRHVLSPTEELHMGQRLFRLCLPLAVNDYLRSGLSTLENLLIPRGLRRYGASGEAAMSTYGTIHGMVFPVLMFAAAILYSLADVLVPVLAKCRASGNRQRILHLTEHCLRWGVLFSATVAGLLFCMAESLGQLLYHSAEAGHYIAVLAPMILILYLDTVVDGMHKGLGQQLYCVRYNTLTSFLDVLFLFLLLPRWGVTGFLFSFIVTHMINFVLSLRRLILVTRYRLTLSFPLLTGLAALAAAIPVRILFSGMATVYSAILCGLCYLTLLTLLLSLTGILSRTDFFWLYSLFFRKKD